jgi:outer membrane protein OmpA-like peptidoglycan-associated protein
MKNFKLLLIFISFFFLQNSNANGVLGKLKKKKYTNKLILERQDSIINQMQNKFEVLQNDVNQKNNQGEIDPKAYKETSKFIETKKEELNALREDIKKYNGLSNKEIKKKLTAVEFEELLVKQNEVIKEAITDVALLDEIRKQKQFDEFETSAFFPPGNYKIPDNMKEETMKSFEPIIDKILMYAEKYPGKQIKATIIVKGFSDEQSISKSSELYKKLIQDFKADAIELPSNDLELQEKINLYLSQLRANEVGDFIYIIAQRKKAQNSKFNNIKIDVLKEGHGYELPNKKLNYNKVDPRRRIVTFYWNVLPIDQ